MSAPDPKLLPFPDWIGLSEYAATLEKNPGEWLETQSRLVHDLFATATEQSAALTRQSAEIAILREALTECLNEHGGFTIAGRCEQLARAALSSPSHLAGRASGGTGNPK